MKKLLLLLFPFLISSCICENKDHSSEILSDLTIGTISAFTENGEPLEPNVNFIVENTISNILNLFCKKGRSEDAPETKAVYRSEYRANSNDAWVQIEIIDEMGESSTELIVKTPSIKADATITQEAIMSFNNSGDYRITQKTDGTNELKERNESNNELSIGSNLKTTNGINGKYIYFNVKGNKFATKEKPSVITIKGFKAY